MSQLRVPFQRSRRPRNSIPFKGIAACQIPPEWRYWLCDTGSLTQRLIHISGGHFRVELLRQQHAPARQDELRCLGLAPRSLPLVREVLLLCHDQPWVYARSVIPRTTELGVGHHLTRLGTRPLGAALFNDPSVRRGTIWLRHETLGNTPANQTLLSWPNERFWGRQCLFQLGSAPILVSEYFLAPCADYSQHRFTGSNST